jgi:hypothetical protein
MAEKLATSDHVSPLASTCAFASSFRALRSHTSSMTVSGRTMRMSSLTSSALFLDTCMVPIRYTCVESAVHIQ